MLSVLAQGEPSGQDPWGALAFIAVLAGAGASSIRHGVQARATWQEKYGKRSEDLRVAIEAQHIVHELASVAFEVLSFEDVASQWLQRLPTTEEDQQWWFQWIKGQLQTTNYADVVSSLSRAYEDLASIEHCRISYINWSHRGVVASSIGIGLGIIPTLALALGTPVWLPGWAAGLLSSWLVWLLGALAAAGLLTGGACWVLSQLARNSFAELEERYG